jgi:very-short-patch-repair endonuclease
MPHRLVPPNNRRLGKVMRRALTPAEFRLWKRLRNRSLGDLRFRRQAPLGRYIVDFFCPERMLIVEVDGDQHGLHSGRVRDAVRDEWLTGGGHLVPRFTNREVLSNIDGVCETLLVAAGSRTTAPPDPSPKSASPISALPQGEG